MLILLATFYKVKVTKKQILKVRETGFQKKLKDMNYDY